MEDKNRRTGRTTRMVLRALDFGYKNPGFKIAVLVASTRECDRISDLFDEYSGYTIERTRRNVFRLPNGTQFHVLPYFVETVFRGFDQQFIDHYVFDVIRS